MPRTVAPLAALFIALAATLSAAEPRPNILFIAVDDLTCSLGCYGDPVAHTPHLDQFARRSVRFDRAYCQVPLCNPSRASVLTGLRPDQLGVYDLERHFRDTVPAVVTLPQLFKNAGWYTARVGKLYHYNVPNGIGTSGLDDPPSWDRVVNPRGRDTLEETLITNAEPSRPISAALSWLAADGTDEEQTDGLVATSAIDLLEQHRHMPFFLGVGFYRPHTPYVAPKRYFEPFPLAKIQLPLSPANDREDIPIAAFAHNCRFPNYGLSPDTCRNALQAYYASVSFVDAQIGRVLAALDRLDLTSRTIVVVWSDHGYHLGEHNGIWQKRCLFEESARTPLVIRWPAAKGNGSASPRIVELVDLYPTLADLAGLSPPANLPGQSLRPLLDEPLREWDSDAVTQVLRPGDGQPIMGRSIRTERWRFTDWNGGAAGVELYDHQNDPHEFVNQACGERLQEVFRDLRQRLAKKAVAKPPIAGFNPAKL